MKNFFMSFALIVVASILAVQPAIAARIYDFLPVHIGVIGLPGYKAAIAPGQRSDSLAWPAALAVSVHAPGASAPLCIVGFKGHAEIQGGNYMTVGHRGGEIICTVCDSNHREIVSNTGNLVALNSLFELSRYPNSRTGC